MPYRRRSHFFWALMLRFDPLKTENPKPRIAISDATTPTSIDPDTLGGWKTTFLYNINVANSQGRC